MKCPDCGAAVAARGSCGTSYRCGSYRYTDGPTEQSDHCEDVAGLRAIVEPLKALLVAEGTLVITRYSASEMRSTSDCVAVTGEHGSFEGITLAEALANANNARKEADRD